MLVPNFWPVFEYLMLFSPQLRYPGEWRRISDVTVPTTAIQNKENNRHGAVEPYGYHGYCDADVGW